MAKSAQPAGKGGRIRCGIYTRKSTEEGLEQEFNSLDAQREACAAYVLSQRHEGWVLLPDRYDDGGFSGGNVDRPGLKQLLNDVAVGKVDVIIVYKVDRLTRSLADFAKIVDVLDGAGASFVSITQAFNTTSSMGRLTLNVLLSFAQFEREVTGERIRDKVAASKRKGMWMGGNVPLGYDVCDRKLVVNTAEAETVRHIFRRYLELGSTTALAMELERQGIRSKGRAGSDGIERGRRVLSRGALALILKNRTYLGEVRHKEEVFPGEHQAIVDRELWDRVQVLTAANRNNEGASSSGHRSLLVARIRDAEGRAMAPTHANKNGRRYRYYVTRSDPTGRPPEGAWRLPAGEIEQLVITSLQDWLRDENAIAQVIAELSSEAPLSQPLQLGRALATRLADPAGARATLAALEVVVQVSDNSITIDLSIAALLGSKADVASGDDHRRTLSIPARLTRRGQELRLAYPPADHRAPSEPDVKLVGLIAKAEAAHRELLDNAAVEKNRRAHLTRLARLRYLAPDIVSAILDGRHPVELSARKLLRTDTIPLGWKQQREMLGFA